MRPGLCFVGQSYVKTKNAGVKPTTDAQLTATELGAKNIGLRSAFCSRWKIAALRNKLSVILALRRMKRGDTVLLQFPEQYGIDSLFRRAKKRGCKVILLIHDIDSLRGASPKHEYILSEADGLIAHTPAMVAWLRERNPEATISVLNLFDYRIPLPSPPADPDNSIVFAGNLAKAPFLLKLSKIPDLHRITLFGVGCPEELSSRTSIDYRGAVLPEDLPEMIASCGFGLVWDGDNIECCNGDFGRYLRYNAPYKASCYLAAGLPLIVWSEMGIAPFVEQAGIGITIDSLKELPERLASLSAEDYAKMRDAVRMIQPRLASGAFLSAALAPLIQAGP